MTPRKKKEKTEPASAQHTHPLAGTTATVTVSSGVGSISISDVESRKAPEVLMHLLAVWQVAMKSNPELLPTLDTVPGEYLPYVEDEEEIDEVRLDTHPKLPPRIGFNVRAEDRRSPGR